MNCLLRSVLAVLVVSIGWACVGTAYAQAEAEPRYGGTLVVAVGSDPRNLNAGFQNFWADAVKGQVFDALVRHSPDTLEPVPNLADSWSVSPDGLTYTFNLVQNAVWHDGVPFTSADVEFSLSEITAQLHPLGRVVFQNVVSVEATDTFEVQIQLKQPHSAFLDFLGIYVSPIMPKHLYEGTEIMENPHNFRDVVGTGPFKLDEWVEGSHLRLARNEDYFRHDLPYLDAIVMPIIPDQSTAILALQSGEVDLVRLDTFEQVSPLMARPDVDVTFRGQEVFGSLIHLLFNTRNAPLNNPEVRRGISHAIDADFINQAVYFGFAHAADSVVGMDLAPWYNPALERPSYDVELANNVLDDLGLPRGADGTRFELRLVTDPRHRQIGDIITDQLGQVGIKVDHQAVDLAVWQQRMWEEWDYDLGIGIISSGPDPTTRARTFFHSESIQPGPLLNAMGYSNPEVDALIDAASSSARVEDAVTASHEFQAAIMRDLPVLPLIMRQFPVAYTDRLKGFPSGPFTGYRDGFHTLWLTDAPRSER